MKKHKTGKLQGKTISGIEKQRALTLMIAVLKKSALHVHSLQSTSSGAFLTARGHEVRKETRTSCAEKAENWAGTGG